MTGAILRTERLILRPWRDTDREPFAALNADPEVRRYFPTVQTRAESDASADFLSGQFAISEYGPWAVEVPGQIPFAGFVGIWRVAFDEPASARVEIGWRLGRACWGRGYATEAARAALAFGFGPGGLDEIVAFVVPANRASRAVMDRIGLRQDPDGDFDHPRVTEGHPLRRHHLYRLRRAEWTPPAKSPYTRQG
ncbi:MAG: GNAT family N-acetyltransferase [Rhodospirillales bacterium]|nr:GNAT family N-acetyltransferase [Rhodospirillales bacterium]